MTTTQTDQPQLYRCMGGRHCNHVPGTCTATNAEYQAKAVASQPAPSSPEAIADDAGLIEQLSAVICRGGGTSLCVGFCHSERCSDAIEMYAPTARAILPFIHQARIDGANAMKEAALAQFSMDPEALDEPDYADFVYDNIRALDAKSVVGGKE